MHAAKARSFFISTYIIILLVLFCTSYVSRHTTHVARKPQV